MFLLQKKLLISRGNELRVVGFLWMDWELLFSEKLLSTGKVFETLEANFHSIL